VALLVLYRVLLERDLDLEGLVRSRDRRRKRSGCQERTWVFERRELTRRERKGRKDRRTMLALGVRERLRVQLWKVRRLHERDLAEGYGSVQRLGALRRNYRNADKQ